MRVWYLVKECRFVLTNGSTVLEPYRVRVSTDLLDSRFNCIMVDAAIRSSSSKRVEPNDTTWITRYEVNHSFGNWFDHMVELRVPNLNIASDIDDIQTQLVKERL